MPKKESLLHKINPDVCISRRLKTFNRVVEKIYRNHLNPFDLTSSQLSILFVVGKKGQVAQSEVGKILLLERSTVSRDLTRLVKRKLIDKLGTEIRPMLKLTEAGKGLVDAVIPSWEKAHIEASELLGQTFVGAMPQLNELRE